MRVERLNVTAVVLGLLFVAIGALFLLDEYDVITLDGYYIVPLLVIGVGLAILLGGRGPGEG